MLMYIMTTLKFISQQNWKCIIPLSIGTHGWNWFPKEMCLIDFLMTLTLQYCNCQYYLTQHKLYFIPTKNAEIVSFSLKCSVFSFYVIRQLVLNLQGRSRLFFLFLVIFQTNQVHIWVFISRYCGMSYSFSTNMVYMIISSNKMLCMRFSYTLTLKLYLSKLFIFLSSSCTLQLVNFLAFQVWYN